MTSRCSRSQLTVRAGAGRARACTPPGTAAAAAAAPQASTRGPAVDTPTEKTDNGEELHHRPCRVVERGGRGAGRGEEDVAPRVLDEQPGQDEAERDQGPANVAAQHEPGHHGDGAGRGPQREGRAGHR